MQMCHEDGLTQAEVLTALIKSEAQKTMHVMMGLHS